MIRPETTAPSQVVILSAAESKDLRLLFAFLCSSTMGPDKVFDRKKKFH
jgi:hypothetical protein